ncbi:hypothetical protein NR402_02110 [Acidithiobacillus ferrooxidans]|uniref:hypothetical protein n=1 Tax=Acidithiobacillus ferrooxidans TaxID=920 RepID=UPI00214C8F10|nr:hypothetical protein [Acidithiobacillus ferrooxidans]MCR2829085.1 hypothetical protein [Acidithiobacillus ferrooxidans]
MARLAWGQPHHAGRHLCKRLILVYHQSKSFQAMVDQVCQPLSLLSVEGAETIVPDDTLSLERMGVPHDGPYRQAISSALYRVKE